MVFSKNCTGFARHASFIYEPCSLSPVSCIYSCLLILLIIITSISLPQLEVKFTILWFPGSPPEIILKIEAIFATFHYSGTWANVSDRLHMTVKSSAILYLNSLRLPKWLLPAPGNVLLCTLLICSKPSLLTVRFDRTPRPHPCNERFCSANFLKFLCAEFWLIFYFSLFLLFLLLSSSSFSFCFYLILFFLFFSSFF